MTETLFAEADSLVYKILPCPRIELSNSQILLLYGVETEVLLSNFAQQLRRMNADVPVIYSTLLDAAGVSLTLVLNQNAKAKERESWVHIPKWPPEAAKAVNARRCCLRASAQFSEI